VNSWEPVSTPAPQVPEPSRPKRACPTSTPEEQEPSTEPSTKKPKIEITDAVPDEVNRSGNFVGDDVKWVSQEDPLPLGHPITQAIWLVAEKSYDHYSGSYQTWFRPATQLSDLIEAQYQANIGCQTCMLSYTRSDDTIIEHKYEHDLRGEEWVQRRITFTDGHKSEIKSSKKILRVMVG